MSFHMTYPVADFHSVSPEAPWIDAEYPQFFDCFCDCFLLLFDLHLFSTIAINMKENVQDTASLSLSTVHAQTPFGLRKHCSSPAPTSQRHAWRS